MDPEDAPAPEPSWFEASEQVLDPLLNARALVAVLEAADAVGLFRALRSTRCSRCARGGSHSRVTRSWARPTQDLVPA